MPINPGYNYYSELASCPGPLAGRQLGRILTRTPVPGFLQSSPTRLLLCSTQIIWHVFTAVFEQWFPTDTLAPDFTTTCGFACWTRHTHLSCIVHISCQILILILALFYMTISRAGVQASGTKTISHVGGLPPPPTPTPPHDFSITYV